MTHLPPLVPEATLEHPLADRVRTTAALLAQRGYVVDADRLAELLQGGPALPSEVRAAAAHDPSLRLLDGFVVPLGSEPLLEESRRRRDGHGSSAARWEPVAGAYASALARRVPWIRCVLASGSLAAGGFTEDDDLDVSLVVEDGTKHLSYVAALLVALPFAWRHRAKPHRAVLPTPFVPKLVCVNVVWTERQCRPFVRHDEAMALETLLSRPLVGVEDWRAIVSANDALLARFPQLARVEPLVAEPPRAPSRTSRALAWLARGRIRRRALDGGARLLARALHGAVRLTRRRGDREHVARLEATKAPYGILEREDAGAAAP